jgi:fluoride exporter
MKTIDLVLVFLGAGLGGIGRHLVNLASARVFGGGFPVGTLLVNVIGSLLVGLAAAYLFSRAGQAEQFRMFVMVGFLGGFTTFSAFSLEFARLAERQTWGMALGYAAASVLLSLSAVFAGIAIGRAGRM